MKNARLIILLFALLSVFLSVQTISVKDNQFDIITVKFPDPTISNRDSFDVIEIEGLEFTVDTGKPMLPMKSISILIPDYEITDVELIYFENISIDGKFQIFPVQPSQPISLSNVTINFTEPDSSVYNSNEIYPSEIFKIVGENKIRDHRILNLIVFPIQYIPLEGKAFFLNNLTFRISYSKHISIANSIQDPDSEYFDNIVKNLVINPEKLSEIREADTNNKVSIQGLPSPTYCPGLSSWTDSDLEYIIITDSEFVSEFQTLADWKTQKGVPAKVVSIDTITNTLSCNGSDTQEKIRNFIKDVYDGWSIDWVLLGGDIDVVPHRGGYGKVQPYIDNTIATDLYYADLDRTWNNDGDSIFGEIEDNISLTYEVFIGRAPVSSLSDVRVFINKTLTYEKSPPTDYEKTALFLAEWLDASTNSGLGKDIIDSDYFPDDFSITKLYEANGTENHTSVVQNLNQGYGIVNHMGHSNPTVMGIGSGSLSTSDMNSLTNSPKYSVLYSMGCLPNAFDCSSSNYNIYCLSDSISEKWILNSNGGGVAFIGNTRYGWFAPASPGQGTSEKYDQKFFNSLFNKDLYHIGQTLADSKADYVSYSNSYGSYRWVQFELNLLGDPELEIWTDNPQNFSVSHVNSITSQSSSFSVHVENLSGSPIQSARVTLWKSNDVYESALTGSSGNVSFSISPHSTGNITVTVTKHNFIPYQGIIVVSSTGASDTNPPIITLNSPFSSATDTDGNITFSYTPTDDSTILNCSLYGNFTGSWALNQTDTAITKNVQDTFNVFSLPNGRYIWNVGCYDNYSNRGFATSNRTLIVGSSGGIIRFNAFMIDDDRLGASYGDNNSQVNPGEWIELNVQLANTQSIDAYSVNATISTLDPYIWIYDNFETFSDITAGSTRYSDSDYDFYVSSLAPGNHWVVFEINISDSTGNHWTNTFTLQIIDNVAPAISNVMIEPRRPTYGGPINVSTTVYDGSELSSVTYHFRSFIFGSATKNLYDDGLHNDGLANDSVFGNYETFYFGNPDLNFTLKINAIDIFNNSVISSIDFTTKPFNITSNVLIVDDDDGQSYEGYYTDALDAIGYSYDVWNVDFRGSLKSEVIDNYTDGIVIWFTGNDWVTTLTTDDQNNLKRYLNRGGKLFISGQDIGYDIGTTTFFSKYLHGKYESDDSNSYKINGISGDSITNGMSIGISGGDGANNQYYPSIVSGINGAETIVYYDISPTVLPLVINKTSRAKFARENISIISFEEYRDIFDIIAVKLEGNNIEEEPVGIAQPPSPPFCTVEVESYPLAIGYGKTGTIYWNISCSTSHTNTHYCKPSYGSTCDPPYTYQYATFNTQTGPSGKYSDTLTFDEQGTWSFFIHVINDSFNYYSDAYTIEVTGCVPSVISYPSSTNSGETKTITWNNGCNSTHTNVHYCTPGFDCDSNTNTYEAVTTMQSGSSGVYSANLTLNEVGTWEFFVHTTSNSTDYFSREYSFNVTGEINTSAGIRADEGSYKVVYLAFGFEAINNSNDRTNLLNKSISWLLNTTREIAYDDGSYGSSLWADSSTELSVKMDPFKYPFNLTAISYYFSVSSQPGTLELHIRDDNGANGGPSSDLLDPIIINATSGWNTINLSENSILITAGSFYVGYRPNVSYGVGIMADTSPPIHNRSFAGTSMYPGYNIAIRANGVIMADISPPNITINYPLDNNTYVTSSVTINYTVEDSSNISNCSIYTNRTGNWLIGNTSSTINATGENIFVLVNLTNGTYTWSIKCIDDVENVGYALQNYTFTISPYSTAQISSFGSYGYTDDKFEYPGDIDIDGLGNIYVAGGGKNKIQIFYSNGSLKQAFGSYGNESGQFSNPRGISVTDDRIYIADTFNHRIQVFNLSGTFLFSFGSYGAGDTQFNYPYSIVVSGNRIYVTDTHHWKVKIFDLSGNLLTSFQGVTSDAYITAPEGIAVSANKIFVSSSYQDNYVPGHDIDVFNLSGSYLYSFGNHGNQTGQFDRPGALVIDNNSRLYVLDCDNNRIQLFNLDGTHILSFGRYGSNPEQFNSLTGIGVDDDGGLYVTDNNYKVQIFDVFAWRDTTPPSTPTLNDPGSADDDGTYTLGWSEASDDVRIAIYEIGEIASSTPTFLSDNSEGSNNWTVEGYWNQTLLTYHSGQKSYWASANGNGSLCSSTSILGACYNSSTSSYMTQEIDLSSCTNATLKYWYYYQIEYQANCVWDRAYVQISTNNLSYTNLVNPFCGEGGAQSDTSGSAYGLAETWNEETGINISNYCGNENVYIRFGFTSDSSVEHSGFFVDDIVVESDDWLFIGNTTGTNYTFYGKQPNSYYYRVRALDTSENEGNWSNVENITVTQTGTTTTVTTTIPDNDPPDITLISPSDNYNDRDGNVFFVYTASDRSTLNCSIFTDITGPFTSVLDDTTILNNSRNSFFLQNISDGEYSWSISCTDNHGNLNLKQPYRILRVSKISNKTHYTSLNVTTNTTARVNSSETNTIIDLTTSEDITDSFVSISLSSNNTANASLTLIGLNKYVTIDASPELEMCLSSALIKVYYTDSEVQNAGINETDLAIYWFNETESEWQRLNSNTMGWVYGTGVETDLNYVWANVSHFSDYTIAEGVETQSIPLLSGWNLISIPLVA
ncbi:MAG: C25 family cysteine peptidase [Candidatus Altiarchaeota archaeon]